MAVIFEIILFKKWRKVDLGLLAWGMNLAPLGYANNPCKRGKTQGGETLNGEEEIEWTKKLYQRD